MLKLIILFRLVNLGSFRGQNSPLGMCVGCLIVFRNVLLWKPALAHPSHPHVPLRQQRLNSQFLRVSVTQRLQRWIYGIGPGLWTSLCFMIFGQFLFSVALIPPALSNTLDMLTNGASCFLRCNNYCMLGQTQQTNLLTAFHERISLRFLLCSCLSAVANALV